MIIASDKTTPNFLDGIFKQTVANIGQLGSYQLERGRKILDSDADCDVYMVVYGAMHYHKLHEAFEGGRLEYLNDRKIEIVDWGCGAAIAASVLVDYLVAKKIRTDIVRITLIDPSEVAIKKGLDHLVTVCPNDREILDITDMVVKRIEDVTSADFETSPENIKIHLFSNIIDMPAIDLNGLFELFTSTFTGMNRIICTGPNNEDCGRLDEFTSLFENAYKTSFSVSSNVALHKEVYKVSDSQYGSKYIGRYEKQITVHL